MPDQGNASKAPAVTRRLIDLITRMPLGEQEALLEEIERARFGFKRRHTRKSVRALVDFATDGRVFKDFTQDISAGGVFIQTRMPFRVGREISLSFVLPTAPERHFKIRGRIVRATARGIGVEFEGAGAEQEDLAGVLTEMMM